MPSKNDLPFRRGAGFIIQGGERDVGRASGTGPRTSRGVRATAQRERKCKLVNLVSRCSGVVISAASSIVHRSL